MARPWTLVCWRSHRQLSDNHNARVDNSDVDELKQGKRETENEPRSKGEGDSANGCGCGRGGERTSMQRVMRSVLCCAPVPAAFPFGLFRPSVKRNHVDKASAWLDLTWLDSAPGYLCTLSAQVSDCRSQIVSAHAHTHTSFPPILPSCPSYHAFTLSSSSSSSILIQFCAISALFDQLGR